MIFDKFLTMVERHLPQYAKIAAEARLFVFDIVPHVDLPKTVESWFDPELFTLPFPVVAIEDKADLMLIWDLEPRVIGMTKKRSVLEVLYSGSNKDAFCDGADHDQTDEAQRYILLETTVEDFSIDKTSITGTVVVHRGYSISDDLSSCVEHDINRERTAEYNAIWKPAAQNISALMQELAQLSHPKYFVMESSSLKQRTAPKKFIRSHERAAYTIVTAEEFRRYVGIPQQSGKKVGGHERRSHLRKYSTEGGHWKQNKTIVIPAIWIGPSEGIVGRRKYRVIL